MFQQAWRTRNTKGVPFFFHDFLLRPFGHEEHPPALVGGPALLHDLADFAVILSFVLAEQSCGFWVCRRVWVRIAQQGLQSKFSTIWIKYNGTLLTCFHQGFKHCWPFISIAVWPGPGPGPGPGPAICKPKSICNHCPMLLGPQDPFRILSC